MLSVKIKMSPPHPTPQEYLITIDQFDQLWKQVAGVLVEINQYKTLWADHLHEL